MTSTDAPVCSIVTINYNNLVGLKRTIKSLDTLPSGIEHVVVDGGSTDGSVEWFRNRSWSRMPTFVSEHDDGVYDAMNKGLKLARGKYVQFLNSGDSLVSVATFKNELLHLEKSGAAWSIARMQVRSKGGLSIKPGKDYRYNWQVETFLHYRVSHPTVIAQAALLRQLGGFDHTFRIAGDYKLLTALGREHKPLTFDDVLVEFELGGLSDLNFEESLWECHRARNELFRYGRTSKYADALLTRILLEVRRSRRRDR